MERDPDAIWKPGYDGPVPDRPSSARFAETSPHAEVGDALTAVESANEPADASSEPVRRKIPVRRRRGRVVVSLMAIGIAGVVAVAVIGSGSDPAASPSSENSGGEPGVMASDPAALAALAWTGEPTAGADPRRLPSRVDRRWLYEPSVDGPAADGVGRVAAGPRTLVDLAAIDDRIVVIIHTDDSRRRRNRSEQARLDVVEAATGAARWSTVLDGADGHRIIGADDDVLLVETPWIDRRVVAFDLVTGDERWRRAEPAEPPDGAGLAGTFEMLEGTQLLARRPNVRTKATLVIDPSNGDVVGRFNGRILTTDHLGAWFVAGRAGVVVHDLADGWSDAVVLGFAGPADPSDIAVVDGRVLTTLNNRIGPVGPGGASFDFLRDDAGEVVIRRLDSITALAGDALLVAGSGRVVGAAFVDGVPLRAWERVGVITDVTQTERGTMVLVSRREGRLEIVDGRTGRTVVEFTSSPDVVEALRFTGNGFLLPATSPEDERTRAIDLAGNEMWSLPGSVPTEIGDGIVVRLEGVDGRFVVSAYGEGR